MSIEIFFPNWGPGPQQGRPRSSGEPGRVASMSPERVSDGGGQIGAERVRPIQRCKFNLIFFKCGADFENLIKCFSSATNLPLFFQSPLIAVIFYISI